MNQPQERANSKRKVRCLVIQLTRLGDTLQSLMALRAAKQLYPELEIYFLARERFAAAAKNVSWLKEVITLPTESILDPIITKQRTEVETLGELARWVSPLVKERWDFIVNWSYSNSSSFLTALLPGRIKLGYTRRLDGSFAAEDGWSHYIQAIVQGNVEQNIHLTDILTTQLLTALQISLGEPQECGNLAVTSKSFFSLSLENPIWTDPRKKWIGIQLGASHESKTWGVENWASLASLMLDRHPDYSIVLLGGPQDKKKTSYLLEYINQKYGETSPERRRVLSLVGQTDFELWARVVGSCSWIIAGDTAVIHLASVLGTRVLNLSIGGVRFDETGPYGNGHYVIASSLPCDACAGEKNVKHTCREDISAEAVYATWTYAASEWAHNREIKLDEHFSQFGWLDRLGKVRVYRSMIRAADCGGGVVFEPQIKSSIRFCDWMAQVMGHVARAWYCGWTPRIGTELSREYISPGLVQNLRQLDESASALAKTLIEARQVATALSRKSSFLKSDKLMNIDDRFELRALGQKLLDIDTFIDRFGIDSKALLPFIRMFKVLMHNLRGQMLTDLGKESAESYNQLAQGVGILRDWIKHTLDLAKPVAVKGACVISISRGKELV